MHYGLYESSDYKRCKVCVKLSCLTDNPGLPGVVLGCVNEDHATGQPDARSGGSTETH